MKHMEIKPKAGTYCFECDPMPWTIYELGEKGDCVFEVYIELSDEDIQTLVDMMIWAWDNEWFEHSTSETVLTELLKKKSLQIYNRVQPLAHKQFISKYPNRKDVEGFGVYEIFPPDEIIEFAREQSKNK